MSPYRQDQFLVSSRNTRNLYTTILRTVVFVRKYVFVKSFFYFFFLLHRIQSCRNDRRRKIARIVASRYLLEFHLWNLYERWSRVALCSPWKIPYLVLNNFFVKYFMFFFSPPKTYSSRTKNINIYIFWCLYCIKIRALVVRRIIIIFINAAVPIPAQWR